MNWYYKNSIKNFINDSSDNIIKDLAYNGGNQPEQIAAWDIEISLLKKILVKYSNNKNGIIFEYTIPRFQKRIDVVLLINNIVFVLEFKVGKETYDYHDIDQVMDYALDLKNFHKESENRIIIPILIATNEKENTIDKISSSIYHDDVVDAICVNEEVIITAIDKVIDKYAKNLDANFEKWVISRYEPIPTIIEAASSLYLNHTVKDITKHEAEGKQLDESTECILEIIKYARINKKKCICFLTGVPGAGKTLVGLNVAIKQSENCDKKDLKDNLAVYLSGNGPLVRVLTASLARDKKIRDEKSGIKTKITDAKREVGRFIQEIYSYREQMINKIKLPIFNGKIEIDENKTISNDKSGFAEIEHVAIFDEAQRSWNHAKLSS